MKVKLFIVDGYWEGKYGSLQHSEERLPRFEETLGRIRSEGHYIGLWTATLRCADPADWGLTTEPHIAPARRQAFHGSRQRGTILPFYILDCSQPEVQRVLTQRARNFMRRYKPDFVQDLLDIGLDSALYGAHHHVLPAHLSPAAFVEHAKRLADARSVAQKHFQPAATLPALVGLHTEQQLFRIGSVISVGGHSNLMITKRPC